MMSMRPLITLCLLFVAACGESTERTDGSSGTDAGDTPRDGGGGSDAGEPPCTPGERRAIECAHCGMASQECGAGGSWGDPGTCLAQGECEAGTEEREATAMCGELTRLCGATCEWTGWEMTTPDRECEPDATRLGPSDCPEGLFRAQTCTEACAWEDDAGAECFDECGGTPRTSPEARREICIPEGSFVRGGERWKYSRPVHEIMMSAYWIDKYVVSNAEYARCVVAGSCTELERTPSSDVSRADYAAQNVTWDQAVAFCTWDGGRQLPTEAQLEKAARGPAPRTVLYPWGEEPMDPVCSTPTADCAWGWPSIPSPLRITDLEPMASYYGVISVGLVPIEWARDWFGVSYYSDPDSRLPDPDGPASGGQHSTRSPLFASGGFLELTDLTARGPLDNDYLYLQGFRCSRTR
jgi:formylglycine-generating enzyme